MPGGRHAHYHTWDMLNRLSAEIKSNDHNPNYTFKFDNLFYFLYYGQITLKDMLFDHSDELMRSVGNKELFVPEPFAVLDAFNFSWKLLWVLHQFNNKPNHKATASLHKTMYDPRPVQEALKESSGLIGVEINQSDLVHKRVLIHHIG
jgi:hypothetical protein